MLALPQFDTAGILRQYAMHPHDASAMLGLHMLKERATRAAMWDAFSQCRKPDTLQRLFYLRLGTTNDASYKQQTTGGTGHAQAGTMPGMGKPMSEITDEEAALMYKAACRQLGIELDLPASVKTDAGEPK